VKKTILIITIILSFIASAIMSSVSYAQPYGKGLYGIIKYGSQTLLTISTNSNVTIPNITPTQNGAIGTGTSTVTVTSTDVMGYKLYISAYPNTYMNNLGYHIQPSVNTYTYPNVNGTGLAVDHWGFNTDGGTNFAGLTSTSLDNLIYSTNAPTTGHNTTVTYGLKVDFAAPAGQYTAQVIYTAVPQTN
jgi:hypothetical protein